MTTVADGVAALAVVPLLMGLLVIAVGVLRVPASGRAGAAELAASLSLGLEFLLAAGLLRLSAEATWTGIATAAALVAVRRVAGAGLRASQAELRPAP